MSPLMSGHMQHMLDGSDPPEETGQETADRLMDALHVFSERKRAKPYGNVGVRIGSMYVELSVRAIKGEVGYYVGALENYGAHKRGTASKMLRAIIDLADAEGVPVFLTPEPFGTRNGRLDLDALTAWYERYGFRPHATIWITNYLEERIEKPLWKREST